MARGTKVRGTIWIILVLVGVFFVARNAYITEDTDVNWPEYFSSVSEEEAGLEYLKITSYLYEEDPIISVTSPDYTFDFHRMILDEYNMEANLYISGRNIKLDNGAPELGIIDVLVYCSTEDVLYEELIGMARLEWLSGTKVLVGEIELAECGVGEHYSIIIDGTKVQEVYGRDEVEIIDTRDHYEMGDYIYAAQVYEGLDLEEGFKNDYNLAGLIQYDWEKALIQGGIALGILGSIGFLLFVLMEKEVFGKPVFKKKR